MSASDREQFARAIVASLRGSAIKRGAADTTVDVAGVSAQKLRYVDLLLAEPWQLQVSESAGYPVGEAAVSVRVPNPAAYIVQKIMVLPKRGADQAKDILYVHDTLVLFGAALEEISQLWARIAGTLPKHTLQVFRRLRATHCTAVNDVVRAASRIAKASGRSPGPTPEEIAAVLRMGTARVFGG